jgi:glycerophosphoryl diester phosphodiesterase
MVAHRGLSGIERENTYPAFIAAANRSYYGIETDVHVTADGKFVVIHDSSTERVSGGAINVNVEEACFDELTELTFPDLDGKLERRDIKIPSLADYVNICKKYGKIAYITVRDRRIESCVDEVYRLLEKYEMKDQCIINSFSFETLSAMRKRNASIRLSLVFGPHKCLTRLHVNRALSLGNCAVCVFWTRDELMAGGLLKKSKAAMAYASEKGVPLHLAHAWDEESYRFALAQGFCGFQCTCTEIL